MPNKWLWLIYAVITVIAMGVWGALISTPEKAGFPATLGYVVWSITMIPPALVALALVNWKLDRDPRSILLGSLAGFTGAGGQLVLFKTLEIAPAYLVFPFIALSPLVTIVLAAMLSHERVRTVGAIGIVLALVAGVLLAYSPPEGNAVMGWLWVAFALLVLIAWGVQGFIISHANKSMQAESIFFYMMVTALALAPVAWAMTDFSKKINWGLTGMYSAAAIQVLNSVGALLLVYAFRYGKAMIVSPLINAGAPVVTIVLSLALLGGKPNIWHAIGIISAIIAAGLMAIEGEKEALVHQEATE